MNAAWRRLPVVTFGRRDEESREVGETRSFFGPVSSALNSTTFAQSFHSVNTSRSSRRHIQWTAMPRAGYKELLKPVSSC